ncbi:MAG: hypothetical protein Q8R60_18850 [Mycobacteriales bacterium]|nr:hypothetical protein [Mycobacteriales bacterium]
MSTGAPVAVLPTDADVRGLLAGLLDKAVVVTTAPGPLLRGRDVRVVGSYVADDGALRAVALCDLSLGACLGAALALVPVPRCEEAIASGDVPPDLGENTREVLNVAASLFNTGEAHLKLGQTWVAPEPVGDDVVALLRTSLHRVDLTVTVPGYGEGVLALLLS